MDYLDKPNVIIGSLKVEEGVRRRESEGDVTGKELSERCTVAGFEDGGRGP